MICIGHSVRTWTNSFVVNISSKDEFCYQSQAQLYKQLHWDLRDQLDGELDWQLYWKLDGQLSRELDWQLYDELYWKLHKQLVLA